MLNWLREFRRRKYLEHLVQRGLQLGHSVFLNDGFFLDPSHCHLITIDDGAVFGPRVTILAHDASTLKVIGKTKIQRVRIGKNAFVGAGAILLPGAEVGDGSILGAGSILVARIPPFEVWVGNPARRIASIDEYREKLGQLDADDFPEPVYGSGQLTEENRRKMLERISLERPGFMVTPSPGV
jgi:maltose O-acetyltransferase